MISLGALYVEGHCNHIPQTEYKHQQIKSIKSEISSKNFHLPGCGKFWSQALTGSKERKSMAAASHSVLRKVKLHLVFPNPDPLPMGEGKALASKF